MFHVWEVLTSAGVGMVAGLYECSLLDVCIPYCSVSICRYLTNRLPTVEISSIGMQAECSLGCVVGGGDLFLRKLQTKDYIGKAN